MSSVKIFLCTNPEDSVLERRALREAVYPKLRDHCRRKHGMDFRVIDPYEASSSQEWPSQMLRRKLLEGCRGNSVGPFFVALIGDQYGAAAVPEQVEVAEFQNILRMCEVMKLNTDVLERCYHRDENAIPAAFCLVKESDSQKEAITDVTSWQGSLQEVKKVLSASVQQCVLEGSLTSKQAVKYFMSGLENDLRLALENSSADNMKRCLCYIHKIIWSKSPGSTQEPLNERLTLICDSFLPDLVTSCGLKVYTTTTKCDQQQGYTAALRQVYIDGLCWQLFTDLSTLIDMTVNEGTGHLGDTRTEQADLCRMYSELYKIERPETVQVKAYLQQKNTQYPLVLTGGPCSGKTVLMAHCAKQVGMWLKSRDPVVITHFSSVSTQQLLNDVCSKIAVNYNQQWDNCIHDLAQLMQAFHVLLARAPSFNCPLILILDGLDQRPSSEENNGLFWLPKCLPVNVKIVISTNYAKSGTLASLKALYPDDTNLFLELAPFQRSNCVQMLTDLLGGCSRKITSGQQIYVNEAVKQCAFPLYVQLLFTQVSLWSSETEVTENSLSQGIHNNIEIFLQRLEDKHGQALVCRSLCLLTLSRYGLTEAELTDILSCEDDLIAIFLSPEDPPYKLRFPEVVVETLLSDLRSFLLVRYVSGSPLLCWACRHFRLVILKRYVNSNELREEIHSRLADYFSGRWAYGRAKPLVASSASVNQAGPQMKMYIDRTPYGQPWFWKTPKPLVTFADFISDKDGVNFRKVVELPYHLKLSERIDELCYDVLLCFDFHQAMFHLRLVQELISRLEDTSLFNMIRRELGLLVCIMKDMSCLLQTSPAVATLQLQSQLFPFIEIYPELKAYGRQLYSENERSGALRVILTPTPTVPKSSWDLPRKIGCSVTGIAIASNGTMVVLLSNGSVWVWNGVTSIQLFLPCITSPECTNLKCSNGYLLLTSSTNIFYLCNMHTGLFEEISSQEERVNTNEHVAVGGFLVTETYMFWWYIGGRNVCTCAITNTESLEGGITKICCPSCITCIACFSEALTHYVFCGQNNGNVSIFDIQNNQPVSLLSCSGQGSLTDMKVIENGLLVCIDISGNVCLWNTDSILSPSLCGQCLANEESGKVLNVDFSDDEEILLICKKQTITVIRMSNCTVEDEFNAPKDKIFLKVILDPDAAFLYALIEGHLMILVWGLCSGQCVLSLNTGSTEICNLINVDGQYLSAVTENGIITWDMNVIRVAASIPKTGSKATKLELVRGLAKHFYTTDGTESVWKWDAQTNQIEGLYQHHGPVTDLAASPNGETLVTVASGEVYVWGGEEGVNHYRISDSLASNVLITPSGHLAVSLSEQGLSRVWRVSSGHVVCSFHHQLSMPIISPESTFVLGLQGGNLLAISLWSGCVNRHFPIPDQSQVLAFSPIVEHPDYVIVTTSSGTIYSWRMSEDTICQRFKMPTCMLNHTMSESKPLQVSADGNYAILSVVQSSIHILDIIQGRLCTVKANEEILYASLDATGKYAAYISKSSSDTCHCSSNPILFILTAIQVSNGKDLGRFFLFRHPCAMTISESLSVYVCFNDGSVGIYAITKADQNEAVVKDSIGSATCSPHLCTVKRWQPLAAPNLTWLDSLL